MKTFTNELGNKIIIETVEKVINGIDGILICIEGPASKTEIHVTRMEAKVLLDQLNSVLI
ncbi:MAG TPA: hypothetical protein VGB97_04860 [Candidatus Paceibacterota bacterium]|jgi:hypothetical protein